MTIGQELLQELTLEAAVTRRFLERVPFDKTAFQPNPKSEKLGRLAMKKHTSHSPKNKYYDCFV